MTMNIEPRPGARCVVGVDLGGTNVRAAAVGQDGRKLGQARGPSDARSGVEGVVSRIVEVVDAALADAGLNRGDVGAVGLAVPGHIDPHTGVIHWSPNFGEVVDGRLRIFLEVPFAEPLSQALQLACFAGNDANVAALGEFRYGAGRDVRDMVLFTLGTGIGGGVISEGRVVTGSTGGAVELGHCIIVAGGRQCGCGTFGCIEAYCGTSAIIERAHRILEENQPSLLFDRIAGDKMTLTPLMVDEAAREGDAAAMRVWEETGYYLGVGIANAVNLFNPELVVLGGGIRKATGLLEAAERSMRRHGIYSLARTCHIVEALLGEDAGMMGAAELAWRHVGAGA
ncbi:MAG: ROK family protein [Chthonomonadales bacterium]|nr:ROK family protein [Chthonomonadales bacterium]